MVVARDIAVLAEAATVIAGPVKDGARAGPRSSYGKGWTSLQGKHGLVVT